MTFNQLHCTQVLQKSLVAHRGEGKVEMNLILPETLYYYWGTENDIPSSFLCSKAAVIVVWLT